MSRDEILPGTLYMLILKTLAMGTEMHGYQIAKTIEARSRDILHIEEGSLYPALQRMLSRGWVKAEWDVTPENRRARYYRLTPQGKKQLEMEIVKFDRVMEAITRVLQPS